MVLVLDNARPVAPRRAQRIGPVGRGAALPDLSLRSQTSLARSFALRPQGAMRALSGRQVIYHAPSGRHTGAPRAHGVIGARVNKGFAYTRLDMPLQCLAVVFPLGRPLMFVWLPCFVDHDNGISTPGQPRSGGGRGVGPREQGGQEARGGGVTHWR